MTNQTPQNNPTLPTKGLSAEYDLLIVGGGINGAGIARDAAGRGLTVLLVERDDLAAHTSSASTKLVHGGLRYLEHYEFGLVRKALREREVLLASAPHIIWPLRFVMPHDPSMRPAWMIRMGLVLYDHLARREVLPGSRRVSLAQHPSGEPLKPGFSTGFVYSDGWVDDARLVVLNALDAAEHGADIRTRTTLLAAHPLAGGWEAQLETNGRSQNVRARALVNAAGPWAHELLTGRLQQASKRRLRLIKGSHIIVPKMFSHAWAYIFQSPDKRIIFAIPYEGEFTLIGTTDIVHEGDPGDARISNDEIHYLCELASRYFRKQVTPDQVVSTYSGVRPLLEDEADDPSAVTRDYQLELSETGPPLMTIWGGKITTFRKLAEEAVDGLVSRGLKAQRGAWTRSAWLPGGDLMAHTVAPAANAQRRRFSTRTPVGGPLDFDGFVARTRQRYAWLPEAVLRRWTRAYGSRVHGLLDGAGGVADLGTEVAPGVYARELEYLCRVEWARTADDVLWRRSKLGLHLGESGCKAVADWLAAHG